MLQKNNFNGSGIAIGNNISMSLDKSKQNDRAIFAILSVLGCVGLVGSFLTMFPCEVGLGGMIMRAVIYTSIAAVSFILPKKLKFAPVVVAVAILLYILVTLDETVTGFKICANSVIEITALMRKGFRTFRIDSATEKFADYYASVFLKNAIMALSFLLSFLTVKIRKFLPVFALTFPFIEVGLAFGIVPSYLFFFMQVSFWLAVLSVSLSGSSRFSYDVRTSFIRCKNNFVPKSNIKCRVSGISALIVFISTFVLLFLICFFVRFSGYSRSDQLNELRQEMATSPDSLTINDIVDLFSSNNSMIFQTNNARLGRFSELKLRNKPVLKVSISFDDDSELKDMMKSSIYLRGDVYSIYNDNMWTPFDDAFYSKYEKMFESINQSSDKPLEIYGSAVNDAVRFNKKPLWANITISNIKSKTATQYVPYGTYPNSGKYLYDCSVSANKIDKKYSFDFITSPYFNPSDDFSNVYEYDMSRLHVFTGGPVNYYSSDGSASTIALFGGADYREAGDYGSEDTDEISAYKEFVRNYCYYYPGTTAMNNVRAEFDTVIQDAKAADSTYDALNILRGAIHSECVYTLSPGRVPADEDFVEYFLLKNKKGYCTYFATAGVILSRMAGIPARYVEGYVISEEDLASAKLSDGSYNISITDNRAHAWTEVYIPELGWLPFEFTPGYSIEMPEVTETTPATETEPLVTTIPSETNENMLESTDLSQVTTHDPAAPVVTTSESSPDDEEAAPFNIRAAILLIVMLLAIILWLLRLYARQKKISRRRERLFTSDSQYDRAISAYEYLEQMLEYLNLQKKSSETYTDYAKKVEEESDVFTDGELTGVSEIAQKAQFSPHSISRDEADRVVSLAGRLSESVYAKANGPGRLYIKYLLNL